MEENKVATDSSAPNSRLSGEQAEERTAREIRKRPCAVLGCHKKSRHKQTRLFMVGTAIKIGFYAVCGEHKNGRKR